MGTAQSQYADDVDYKSPRQSKSDEKLDAQRIAIYNKKRKETRRDGGRANSKSDLPPKHDPIAIAELMSYLKVVAAHASNLPLTTRDDPELGRTVSSLTAEEYAMKSTVFIPSDVRVIGGISSKYNSHWEYPNKRDLDLSERVTESSHRGGACCNAMLKALYDNENDDTDMMVNHNLSDTDNLFDDDEDESVDDDASIESIAFDDVDDQNGPVLTWAGMLRNMKDEMEDFGNIQVPAISTSRRFDLNEPFSLVPNSFDPRKNKKIALLIGCNYLNSSGEISTSHDDIRSMKDYILNVHGFSDDKDSLTILLDDGEHTAPTQNNIIRAFEKIASVCKKGDAVVIQFSGHGARVLDTSIGVEVDCYEEVLFPCDYEKAGAISDTVIFKSLLAPLAKDVTVTIILDSIDTGVMLDMPYSWSTMLDNTDAVAKLSLNDDFSFVRFLKVLKMMYEKSTYTKDSMEEYDGDNLGYDSDSVGDGSFCTVGDDDNSDSGEEEDDSDSEEGDDDSDSGEEEDAGDDQTENDNGDLNGFDDNSLKNASVGSLNKSNDDTEECMMTTIGGYFKPPTGLQTKAGSTKPPRSLPKKAVSTKNQIDGRDANSSARDDKGGSFFSDNSFVRSNSFVRTNSFVRSLSAQNIYNQFFCASAPYNESEGSAPDNEIEVSAPDNEIQVSASDNESTAGIGDQPKFEQQSSSYYDDNDDYFIQDSYSDETLSM